ncbi:MAG: hypothetical protein ACFCGT_01550 [Sandaracinaceae bacterium]
MPSSPPTGGPLRIHPRSLAVALALATLGVGCPGPGVAPGDGGMCATGQERCRGRCVDVRSDPDHCNACGRRCPRGSFCVEGRCFADCPGALRACADRCVDLGTDLAHCGACDASCAGSEVCERGRCVLRCPGGQTGCGTTCHDLDADPRHCGACDASCAAGESCVDGECALVCAEGQTACAEGCTDLMSDPRSCGSCDVRCGSLEVCDQGRCQSACGGARVSCDGACVDLASAPNDCGECDRVCPGAPNAFPVCAQARCATVCREGFGDCNRDTGGADSDGCEIAFATDRSHCGGCGQRCELPHAASGCSDGGCVIVSCEADFDDCDEEDATGCEADLRADPAHCGACGIECGVNEICVGGACRASGSGEDCDGRILLRPGLNALSWTATDLDVLTSTPDCPDALFAPAAPDIVMEYQATAERELVRLVVHKPPSLRYLLLSSDAACGTVEPALDCRSTFAGTTLVNEFVARRGAPVFTYLADTTSAGSIEPPTILELEVTDCTNFASGYVTQPTAGSTLASRAPVLRILFDEPVERTVGRIVLGRSGGADLTFDLALEPDVIVFEGGDTILRLDPGITFDLGEVITLTWNGIIDRGCGTPVEAPAPGPIAFTVQS